MLAHFRTCLLADRGAAWLLCPFATCPQGLAFQAWAILNKDKFKPEGPAKGKGAAATGSATGPAAAAGGGKKSK